MRKLFFYSILFLFHFTCSGIIYSIDEAARVILNEILLALENKFRDDFDDDFYKVLAQKKVITNELVFKVSSDFFNSSLPTKFIKLNEDFKGDLKLFPNEKVAIVVFGNEVNITSLKKIYIAAKIQGLSDPQENFVNKNLSSVKLEIKSANEYKFSFTFKNNKYSINYDPQTKEVIKNVIKTKKSCCCCSIN